MAKQTTNHHHAPNYVIACIDFRFQADFLAACDARFGVRSYDYHTFPGASKALLEPASRAVMLASIREISQIHQTERIVVLDHQDCGAYGGSKRFSNPADEAKFHQKKLREAARVLRRAFPQFEVVLLYWTPDGVQVISE